MYVYVKKNDRKITQGKGGGGDDPPLIRLIAILLKL